jgi:hypothetical protein
MKIDVSDVKAKALRLIGIANELLAMARLFEEDDASEKLLSLAAVNTTVAPRSEHGDHPLWAELAREHYRNRRRRDKIFATETLFGEPAWDIMLDLFIAAKENRRVSVMSACIGAAVPSTTALRWISALEREDLLSREDDPDDARRTYVLLTPRGYAAMVDYFDAASRTLKPAVLAKLNRLHEPLPEPRGLPMRHEEQGAPALLGQRCA